ncbi:MAG: chain-length determining protein [Desulfobacter sp.]|nr:MAG: chain-length determining protein [Desulfobacter sp.]
MEEQVLTPQDYINILKRRKWSLIVPFILIVAIAAVTAWLLPAIYKSTATVLIEQREIPAEYVMSSQTSYAEQRMQNIKQRTLTSKQLQQLIRQFDLYREDRDKLTIDEILDKMREEISLTPVNVEITDKRSGRAATATIAFTLSYEGKHPEKVQQVTDRIVTLFLKEDLKERTDQASSTHEFLRKEKEKIKLQLDETEAKLAAFKKENSDSLPELFQVNMQALNAIDRNTEQAKENLRALKEKKEALEEELANTTVNLEDEITRNQKEDDEKRLEMLKMELINLKTKFSDLYPDVKKLQREINELAVSIAQRKKEDKERAADLENDKDMVRNPAYVTLSSRLAGLRSDIDSVETRIRDLDEKAEEYRRRLAATPDVEAVYNDMVTERNNLMLKYKDMQAKMMEAKVAHALESQQKGERFSLIESATLPEKPFKPNRLAIVLIGFVLGIGAGIGMAAITEFSDDSVRDADTLERVTGFPVLTTIPCIITREDRVKAMKIRMIWLGSSLAALVLLVFIFDTYVMDLDVFWSKLVRKLS